MNSRGAAGLTATGRSTTAYSAVTEGLTTPGMASGEAQMHQGQQGMGLSWETALERAFLHQVHLTHGLIQYFNQQQLPACAQLVGAAVQQRASTAAAVGGVAAGVGAVPEAADLFHTPPTVTLPAGAPAAPRPPAPPVGPPLAPFEVAASTTNSSTTSSSSSRSASEDSDTVVGAAADGGQQSSIISAALQLLAPPEGSDPAGVAQLQQTTQLQPHPQPHHRHHHHQQQQHQHQQLPAMVTGAQRIMRALVGASGTATPSPSSTEQNLAGLRRRLQAARDGGAAAGGGGADQAGSSSTGTAVAGTAPGSTTAAGVGGDQSEPETSPTTNMRRLRSVLWVLDVAFLLLFVPVAACVTWLLLPSDQQHYHQQGTWSTLLNWLCLVAPLLLPWAEDRGLWARGVVGVAQRDKAIAWSQLLSTAAAVLPTIFRSSAIDGVVQQLPWLTNSFSGVLLWSSFAKPWAPPVDKWPAVICSLCRLLETTSHLLALRRCVDQEAWQRLQASAAAPLGVLVPLVGLLPMLPAVVVHATKSRLSMPA